MIIRLGLILFGIDWILLAVNATVLFQARGQIFVKALEAKLLFIINVDVRKLLQRSWDVNLLKDFVIFLLLWRVAVLGLLQNTR